MKLPLKWLIPGVLVLALGAGLVHTLLQRADKQKTMAAQVQAQQQEAALELQANDLVQAQNIALNQVLAVSGALKAVNSAFVKVRVAGELQRLVVREGDNVQAGQVLGRIDSTEPQARVRQAQQQAQAARAQVDIAQRTLDNNQSLVNQGFISKTALDTALNTLAAAQATYQAAVAGADVAQKALDDTVLRAPLAGQVAQRLAQNGERLAVDSRVLEIVDLRALELEAALGAADSVPVRPGQSAQLRVEGVAQPVAARVLRINPSTAPGSRSVLVYLAVQPGPGLRQGLFAQGTLVTGQLKALAVPLDAVRTDKPQPYVQRKVQDQVRHQQVTLGATGESAGVPMVQVQGLEAGDWVLRGNVGALRDGTRVTLSAGKP